MSKLTILIAVLFCFSVSAQEAEYKIRELLDPVVKVQLIASSGSGVVVYSQEKSGFVRNFILTNYHVIDRAIRTNKMGYEVRQEVKIQVTTTEDMGRDQTVCETTAYIVTYNKTLDVALLEVTDKSLRFSPVKLLPKEIKLELFQKVWNVGHPGGLPITFSNGMITQLGKDMHFGEFGTKADYIRTNAPIYFGNSGGATFLDLDGGYYLIGMPTRIRKNMHHAVPYINYSVSITSIRKFFKEKDLGFIEDTSLPIPKHVKPLADPPIDLDFDDVFEFIIPEFHIGPPLPR